jgi:hypothetical protein
MNIDRTKILDRTVQYFESHVENARIKKMLYCLCAGRWEKEGAYLDLVRISDLVEQIAITYPNLDAFKKQIQELIKTVNKPQEYLPVAKIVYAAVGQIYPEFHEMYEVAASTQLATKTLDYAAAIVPGTVGSAVAPPLAPPLAQPIPSADDADGDAYDNYGGAYPHDNGANYGDYGVPAATAIDYDPFALRQNIMNYANPLRVKILLLVIVNPYYTFNPNSAAAIREYSLDDLLLQVIDRYPTIDEIENQIGLAVEQLIDVEEYGKAATGLIQALLPIYNNNWESVNY